MIPSILLVSIDFRSRIVILINLTIYCNLLLLLQKKFLTANTLKSKSQKQMEYVVVVGLVASDATFMTPNRIGLVFLHLMFAVLEASMIRCTNTNPISVGKRKKTLPVICMLGDGLMNLLRLELCRRIHVVFQQEQRYILVEQVGIPFFLC